MNYYTNNSQQLQPKSCKCNVVCKENFPLFNPDTAYTLGNLFEGLYESYKGFTNYPLNPSTQREQLLIQLLMHKFVGHELNLYLDIYPDDTSILTLFNQNNNVYQSILNQFENNYGGLTVSNVNTQCEQWSWIDSPWPWENECEEN